jgi:hypothetical protein
MRSIWQRSRMIAIAVDVSAHGRKYRFPSIILVGNSNGISPGAMPCKSLCGSAGIMMAGPFGVDWRYATQSEKAAMLAAVSIIDC